MQETNGNEHTTENDERLFDFSTSDFAKLLKTKSFIDKTLMIKNIFNGPSRILITAPPRFGKSTNIDMIKRFLEIEVDTQCTPKDVHTTKNYKLFKDNNLLICKYEEFFNEHFGKHPVIHIDLAPLSGVRDFIHMLDVIRTVIRKSFCQHSYVLDNNNRTNSSCCVNGFDIDDFRKHVSHRFIKDVDTTVLKSSLEYLSRILYNHFGKEVFVLIDNYDAFIKSTLSRQDSSRDTEEIIFFVKEIVDNLLKNNKCVDQALLTSVLPVIGGVPFFNSECYWFMGSHPFCESFGLTSSEMYTLLPKLILTRNERKKTKSKIKRLFGLYINVKQSVRLYHICSVLKFVCRGEIQDYRVHIKAFEPLFENNVIRRNTSLALADGDIQMDESQILSTADILELSKVIKSGEVENICPLVANKLFLLLYHFGYLTIRNASPNGSLYLRISNETMRYELASVYLEETQFYHEEYEIINNIWFNIESFRPENTAQDAMIISFGNAINDLQQRIYHNEHKTNSILFALYFIVLAKSKYSKTLLLSSGTDSDMFYRIVVRNVHNVIICISAFSTIDFSLPVMELRARAEISHNKIIAVGINRVFGRYSRFFDRVIIAVASKVRSPGIFIAYSYHFLREDSLRKCKVLAVGF